MFRQIVAAGYALYGSATMIVISHGHGVHGFMLDPSMGEFVLTDPNMKVRTREIENKGRGPIFGDFFTIRTEASMKDVTVARLQSTRVQTPLSLPPLLNVTAGECLFGQSKYTLRNTKEKGVVGNLCISLDRTF